MKTDNREIRAGVCGTAALGVLVLLGGTNCGKPMVSSAKPAASPAQVASTAKADESPESKRNRIAVERILQGVVAKETEFTVRGAVPVPDNDPTPPVDPPPDIAPTPNVDPAPGADPAPTPDPVPDVDPAPTVDQAPVDPGVGDDILEEIIEALFGF